METCNKEHWGSEEHTHCERVAASFLSLMGINADQIEGVQLSHEYAAHNISFGWVDCTFKGLTYSLQLRNPTVVDRVQLIPLEKSTPRLQTPPR